MAKILVNVPDEMYDELQKESAATRAPIAAIVRMSLEDRYAKLGKRITSRMQWGGLRKPRQK